MDKRFLNTKELAAYLGLSENTIRGWVRTGKIPHSKLGGAVRFDLIRLESWFKKNEYPYIGKNHLDSAMRYVPIGRQKNK